MKTYGFHTLEGWWFQRLDDGRVQVTHTDPTGETVHGQVVIEGGPWCSVVATVSAKGETSATWQEALRFHYDRPEPPLPQCCFIESGKECENPALCMIVDGPAPDDYTHACQHHVKDLISDTALVYPLARN